MRTTFRVLITISRLRHHIAGCPLPIERNPPSTTGPSWKMRLRREDAPLLMWESPFGVVRIRRASSCFASSQSEMRSCEPDLLHNPISSIINHLDQLRASHPSRPAAAALAVMTNTSSPSVRGFGNTPGIRSSGGYGDVLASSSSSSPSVPRPEPSDR